MHVTSLNMPHINMFKFLSLILISALHPKKNMYMPKLASNLSFVTLLNFPAKNYHV